MAKRDSRTTRAEGGGTPTTVLAQRVVAFGEQLGRLAGTFQAKAEGWLDPAALNRQIAGVRDGAADLLGQLAAGTATPVKKKRKRSPSVGLERAKGRSGGAVDAPGKKHRPPPPTARGASSATSQATKARAATTKVKTNRPRART